MAEQFDVIVLGAGAAGMMCAIRAARRGRSVAVVDHARTPGEKIRISGGGRCNFTNIHASHRNYISGNPHFAKSALARFSAADFVAMVDRHQIPWHEKALGQLFCDTSAQDIIRMLLEEMRAGGVTLSLSREIASVEKTIAGFRVSTSGGEMQATSLVLATGGKSIPKMGATGFAYRIAEQFGLKVTDTRAGLVPLTLDPAVKEELAAFSGLSLAAEARCGKTAFREQMLFTHRGISGPAILQISSYWREGDEIAISVEPEADVMALLKAARSKNGRQSLQTVLAELLPRRLAQHFAETLSLDGPIADMPDKTFQRVEAALRAWTFKPAGSEGYRTAEVTIGGVDTADLNSRDMAATSVPGLYFIGECVDVTGWLGGYNFQWAWSSGVAAGDAV